MTHLDRAVSLYGGLFGIALERVEIHGHTMALFPETTEAGRVTGALAAGGPYLPVEGGVLIYLSVAAISPALERIVQVGGRVVFPRTSADEFRFVAEFIDSEGNRIGLMAST